MHIDPEKSTEKSHKVSEKRGVFTSRLPLPSPFTSYNHWDKSPHSQVKKMNKVMPFFLEWKDRELCCPTVMMFIQFFAGVIRKQCKELKALGGCLERAKDLELDQEFIGGQFDWMNFDALI
jgi:hypothetical protein